jgi:hypothetical protein
MESSENQMLKDSSGRAVIGTFPSNFVIGNDKERISVVIAKYVNEMLSPSKEPPN